MTPSQVNVMLEVEVLILATVNRGAAHHDCFWVNTQRFERGGSHCRFEAHLPAQAIELALSDRAEGRLLDQLNRRTHRIDRSANAG